MFPLKDNIPARVFPVVNIALIVANLLFFIYVFSKGDMAEHFLGQHGFVPARFLASANFLFVPGQVLSVFSSMFLHGSIMHLFGNMWMLWIFGDNVEDAMGHGRYLLFYLLCGVASVMAQTVAAPVSLVPMVGASGAISGVLGAYFCLYPRARILTLLPLLIIFYIVEIPAYFFLGFWFLLQFIQGWVQVAGEAAATAGVAWWAHVGGFGAGVLLIRFFRNNSTRTLGKRLQL
ncbi:MAG: rhomboid family intramembrane serine protease [Desulfobulbaceae bacterium]|nr:rhomboid family intramembrane serine protease [Desulfobulbaceae bacterium]